VPAKLFRSSLSIPIALLLLALSGVSLRAQDAGFEIAIQGGVTPVVGAPLDLVIERRAADGSTRTDYPWLGGSLELQGLTDLEGRALGKIELRAPDPEGRRRTAVTIDAEGRLIIDNAIPTGTEAIGLVDAGVKTELGAPIAGWLALAPALLAILLAILFRQVYLALFAGVYAGAWAIAGGPWDGFRLAVTDVIPTALAQGDKISIIIFSTLLGGVVASVARMGGTRALVEIVASRGDSSRGAQFSTWLAGVMIFFDDYANALLVGNTMRPVTDRFRVSREKLAFLVDSTSAPVACIFIISTWIATEIAYIQDRLGSEVVRTATGFGADAGYEVFLQTIPFNFYPIFCLVFGLTIAITGRDYGPMLRAERRAKHEGKLLADGATPLSSPEMDELEPADPSRSRWWNAAVPILTIVVCVLGFLHMTGAESLGEKADVKRSEAARLEASGGEASLILELRREAELLDDPSLREIFGASDSYVALMLAAFIGIIVSILLAVGQRLMSLGESIEVVTAGIKAMIPAVLVLVLAWSLQAICERLGTSEWLVQHVSFTAALLPMVIFILSAFVGFSTGTSWGTMGILVPLTIDYAVGLGADQGMASPEIAHLMVASIGGVLAGAVFGDHCSPISDTTIMSSMASGADHVDHVKTQMPYALSVAAIAILFGYLPAGLRVAEGVPHWVHSLSSPLILLPVGTVVTVALVRIVGRRA
jgi:Na+/H+ antiporter NhaC